MATQAELTAIAAHPDQFAAWVAGVQRNQAASVGVDPVYAQASQQYGYLAAYLNHPEIGPILRRAAAEGWSPELLQGAISKTQWWQTKAAGDRQFDLLLNTDYATANKQIHSKAMELQAQAAQMGLNFTDWKSVTNMAEQVLRDPTMGPDQIKWMLGSQLHFDQNNPVGGTVGQTVDAIKARAAQFMIPMTDDKAFEMSKSVAMGLADPASFDQQLREQAKKQYAWLAPELDQGNTMKDLFDSTIQSVANLLEVDPNQIDLTSQQFKPILETVDSTTGARRSMTTTEAETFVRGTSAYDQTKGAQAKAATFGENLMKTFGKVA